MPKWHQVQTLIWYHLKQCSILSIKSRDRDIIESFLETHTESDVCYFHTQQQIFIERHEEQPEEQQEPLKEKSSQAKQNKNTTQMSEWNPLRIYTIIYLNRFRNKNLILNFKHP